MGVPATAKASASRASVALSLALSLAFVLTLRKLGSKLWPEIGTAVRVYIALTVALGNLSSMLQQERARTVPEG